jgi:hypothetical protein
MEGREVACDKENGSVYAGHQWYYGQGRRSGEPYRECKNCFRFEIYYLDDLELERELGLA